MTVPALNAIETTYAGHRFRSRLEARWAVFFDQLSVAWEYEPQGYLVGKDKDPYLPDFWLPEQKIWIEVKGHATDKDLKIISAAAHPVELGGLPELGTDAPMSTLVVLSNIPRGPLGLPLHACPGWSDERQYVPLLFVFWAADAESARVRPLQPALGKLSRPEHLTRTGLVDVGTHYPMVTAAYQAARTARFEHCEQG